MGVGRDSVANIGNPTGLVRDLGDHEQAKTDGGQMNRGDIGGVVVRLFLEEA